MYKKQAQVIRTPAKRPKKEQKPKKTDDTVTVSKKAPIEHPIAKRSPKSYKSMKSNGVTNIEDARTGMPLLQQIIIQREATASKHDSPSKAINNDESTNQLPESIPSAIKFRVSYAKSSKSTYRGNDFQMPSSSQNDMKPDDGSKLLNGNECSTCSSNHKLNGATASIDKKLLGTNNSKEEFYKYLGIDTNPTPDKSDHNYAESNALNYQRRSLRVFIQQKQYESISKSNEKLSKCDIETEPLATGNKIVTKSSPKSIKSATEIKGTNELPSNLKELHRNDETTENLKLNTSISMITNEMDVSTSSHILHRRSYEPLTSLNSTKSSTYNSKVLNDTLNASSTNCNENETDMECDNNKPSTSMSNRLNETALSTSDQMNPRVVRITKRKLLLPSSLMFNEMFKRYKQCLRQDLVLRNHFQRQKVAKRTIKRSSETEENRTIVDDDNKANGDLKIQTIEQNHTKTVDNNQINAADEHMNAFSPTSITHSNASTDSAIVVNSNSNELNQSLVTVNMAKSIQWHQDQINGIDRIQFRNPIDPNHGAILSILTHSTTPNQNDIVVVVQESLISYWYSTSKVLSMFGIARSWLPVGQIQRFNRNGEWSFVVVVVAFA